jgi:hypothetical protein
MDESENTHREVTRRVVLEAGTAAAAILITGLRPNRAMPSRWCLQ